MKRSDAEDRCVDIDMVNVEDDGGETEMPDSSMPDPGSEIDAGPDGSMMAAPMEAGTDDGGEDTDAGDAGEHVADECSVVGGDAWKAFHIAPGLLSHIVDCATRCAGGACELDACLRDAAGVDGCGECVAGEVQCMTELCSSACGASSTDEACLACACEQGCTLQFATCAAASRGDTCEDCDADVCEANMSVLPPALIMAVLHPVLFVPPIVMPVIP